MVSSEKEELVWHTKAYSEPCQTSKMKRFSLLDVWQGSEYASDIPFNFG